MIKAGIDWGSSSFRAYRFDQSSTIVETVATQAGLKFVADASQGETCPFQECLFNTVGHWLTPGDTVLLSGMVTSRSGWQETPYLSCPADLSSMMDHAVTKTVNEVQFIFLPGLSQLIPSPDVIRGEELQMLGASQTLVSTARSTSSSTDVVCILPGTHSKWALLKDGDVQRFHTIATGELFELLTQHSLIGAFATDGIASQTAFTDAVSQGYNSDTVISDLFSCRSGILLNVLETQDVKDRLSGLLIGHEIREGMSLLTQSVRTESSSSMTPDMNLAMSLGLIGSDQLCARYLLAFQHLSIDATLIDIDAAAMGFQELMRRLQQT